MMTLTAAADADAEPVAIDMRCLFNMAMPKEPPRGVSLRQSQTQSRPTLFPDVSPRVSPRRAVQMGSVGCLVLPLAGLSLMPPSGWLSRPTKVAPCPSTVLRFRVCSYLTSGLLLGDTAASAAQRLPGGGLPAMYSVLATSVFSAGRSIPCIEIGSGRVTCRRRGQMRKAVRRIRVQGCQQRNA